MTVGPVSRNSATESFFDHAARGEFLLLRCRPGGHFSRPQATVCSECGSTEFDEVPAGGPARLISWVVVPERPHPDRPPGPPDIPAIVEFAEGPWWWSKLIDADPAELRAGQALQLRFEQAGGGEPVPVFAPEEA